MGWTLKDADLKKYPHFDRVLSIADATALANDASGVAHHAFYPFIRYPIRWTRFAEKGQVGKAKKRLIRYAARSDAYIFSRYRYIVAERYETELARRDLSSSVLAYRRIPVTETGGGKCNIHFARDAILKIRSLGDCCAIALDISNYFENLDHEKIKALWRQMLGTSKLPDDHFAVFRNITKYSWVEKTELYERLGYYGVKRTSKTGKEIKGYLVPYDEIRKQLCTGARFREMIAKSNGQRSIIRQNWKSYGIPQGAAISDLLANLYLIDFDQTVKGWVAPAGAYYRYSDDILIIVAGGEDEGVSVMERVCRLISEYGRRLQIKQEKSSVFTFVKSGDRQICRLVRGTQGRNGLEHLGFRYDERSAYIRDSTLANLQRKIVRTSRQYAEICARRFPDKGIAQLRALFDYERVIERFGRVEDFDDKQSDFKQWTFWSYARKAAEIFGPLGGPILSQLRHHRAFVRRQVDLELLRAVARRAARGAPLVATPATPAAQPPRFGRR